MAHPYTLKINSLKLCENLFLQNNLYLSSYTMQSKFNTDCSYTFSSYCMIKIWKEKVLQNCSHQNMAENILADNILANA